MKKLSALLILSLVLLFACGKEAPKKDTTAEAQKAGDKIVRLYGAGGLKGPLTKCAEMFQKETNTTVELILGPEQKWIGNAKLNADLIFPGTESITSEYILRHKGLIDPSSRTLLYNRGTVIVVRKGNPKNIKTLDDLAKDGIKLVEVVGPGLFALGEDTAGRKGLLPGIQKNTVYTAVNGAGGAELWKTKPEIDAWITLEPWFNAVKETGEIVRIPEIDRIYRGGSIVITANSKKKAEAKKFIDFLKTEKAHAVFKKFGWQ